MCSAFPWAGAAPAGSGVGSAGSADPTWVPPPMPGEQQGLHLWGHLSSDTARRAGGSGEERGEQGWEGECAGGCHILKIGKDEMCSPDQS